MDYFFDPLAAGVFMQFINDSVARRSSVSRGAEQISIGVADQTCRHGAIAGTVFDDELPSPFGVNSYTAPSQSTVIWPRGWRTLRGDELMAHIIPRLRRFRRWSATRRNETATAQNGSEIRFAERADKDYASLTPEIRKAFAKQMGFLLNQLSHPSLRAKKYDEANDIWQARVNRS
jgi:hypothetical protein